MKCPNCGLGAGADAKASPDIQESLEAISKMAYAILCAVAPPEHLESVLKEIFEQSPPVDNEK